MFLQLLSAAGADLSGFSRRAQFGRSDWPVLSDLGKYHFRRLNWLALELGVGVHLC